MVITYLKYSNVEIGNTEKATKYNIFNVLNGIYYTFKEQHRVSFDNKLWVPSMQNTNCGWRVNTQNEEYFSKYWDGFIFVDVDHLEEDPDAFLDGLHNSLCKYQFYLASQTSYNKNGFHLIFYIPKQKGTVEEYYHYASYVYTILFNGLIPKDNYDWHNYQHHQVLKIAQHKWKINTSFKIEPINIDDSLIDKFFLAENKRFISLYYNKTDDSKPIRKLDNKRYSYTEIDESRVNEQFFYFEHTDRWKLFMTLMYIYNCDTNRVYETACKIMKYSKTNKHSYNELCNYFDPIHTHMDWYKKYEEHNKKHPDASTSKLDFLEKYFGITLQDKYDTKVHMKDNEYLLDYKELVYNSLISGINFLQVDTGGGKTTFWDTERPNAIVIEPYGSIIEDKYDKDVHKAAGPGKAIDISQSYQVSNYWRFIDFVNFENKFYEYIVVDESHLVGTQNFRNHKKNGHTMIDFISALNTYHLQYPETKIVLQTATPSNEFNLFNIKNKLTFSKDLKARVDITYDYIQHLNNNDEYINNVYASILYLVNKMHNEGRKVYIYWGNGGVNIMKAIQKLIKILKSYSCAVYHKRNDNSFDMDYIHNNKIIGDYDVLISSCYFSVGCDLNDECNAGIIIIGNNTFQDDVQVIGRFRKSKDIDVHILPDKISNIKKVDVSELLLSMQKRIYIENEIHDMRNNTIITALCDNDDVKLFTYMECAHEYFCDLERKFELYKNIGYTVHNTIIKQWNENEKSFFYDVCSNINDTYIPMMILVNEGLENIKDELKKYYKTNEEIQLELYDRIKKGDRDFKSMKKTLNDRPKLQDWVRIIEIFSKHYELDYMLHIFTDDSMTSITHQQLEELLKWKMKLNKGTYDKIEKILIDNLIENYDNIKGVKKNIEIWMLLYYCVWVSNAETQIDHKYDIKNKKIFYIWNQWQRRISSILFVDKDIRNYILNYGVNDNDIIFASIPDFLKDIYEKNDISNKIKTFLNAEICSKDIAKFLNIKLAKYNKEICTSTELESNLHSLANKFNIKGCIVTDKFNKKKIEKYKLNVGKRFESRKEIAEYCGVKPKVVNDWLKKEWIRNLN